MRLGSDTGGTFTDLVDDRGRSAKVPSTPADPAAAVRSGIELLRGSPPGGQLDEGLEFLGHGTTVATNALLERRGGHVALVATEGLADVIEIARQDRPSLYDPFVDRPEPLVRRDLRFELRGRLDATGRELEPVDLHQLEAMLDSFDDVDAVAVCLLHADLEPAHEGAVARLLRARGLDVTCSSEVSPTFREYERTVTTVVNAYLRPRCRTYLSTLRPLAAEVQVLSSAGGLLPLDVAAELPVALTLSGPAGGVRAGAAAALANDEPDAVTFDMGGTSTDVCLVRDGAPEAAGERVVAGFPLRFPALDVLTIGAGGGSLAWLDAGGALRVGPQSAGAEPGPACYGRGGRRPTVTDANLVAGRIPAGATFPGIGRLDVDAARAALHRAGVTAEGVLRVVDASMEQALRAVTVARGVDPRSCALVAFGGAGPLHAASLAGALGMQRVIVPARAGVLSAVGVLDSPTQRDLVRSWPEPARHEGVDQALRALGEEAARLVGESVGCRPEDVEIELAIDGRYRGQSHEITVPAVVDFHRAHEQRNGYARADAPIEIVALRATARHRRPARLDDHLPARASATGPAVIAEPDCTVWVPAGWRARPGAAGALLLERSP